MRRRLRTLLLPAWFLHTPVEIAMPKRLVVFLTLLAPEPLPGFRPDGRTAATLIPPAFGLAGANLHDGRFPTLLDVIQHYDQTFALGLTAPQESDLAEYLRSL